MKWDSLSVTNVLLLIIAIMMLILIVGQPSPRPMAGYGSPSMPAPQNMGPPPVVSPLPSAEQAAGPNPHMPTATGDFDFQNMVYAALACPEDPAITLADFGCKGDDAKQRRETVQALAKQGLPPRMMFDEIIEIYGLDALTDEAKEIRRTNRASQ